jgi:hypothetical protein
MKNSVELGKLIKTYEDHIRSLRSKIEANNGGPQKLLRRRRHLSVLEGKLEQAIEAHQEVIDRSYWGR